MIVKVACESDERGEATPRRLSFDGRTVELTLVLDRWLGADHSYFKMAGDDGVIYILRHDIARDVWELTMYAVGAAHP
jgi:hypothetical protein